MLIYRILIIMSSIIFKFRNILIIKFYCNNIINFRKVNLGGFNNLAQGFGILYRGYRRRALGEIKVNIFYLLKTLIVLIKLI